MELIWFNSELILVLAHEELDECVLANDQALPLLLLIEGWGQERHHVLSKCSQFTRWWQLFDNLSQYLINFLKKLILVKITSVLGVSVRTSFIDLFFVFWRLFLNDFWRPFAVKFTLV